jgi:hypothetical protein
MRGVARLIQKSLIDDGTVLLLSGIAALFLATGTAHAERIPPPDHSKCTNCRNAADHKFFSCAYYWLYRNRRQELDNPNADRGRLALEARRGCGR